MFTPYSPSIPNLIALSIQILLDPTRFLTKQTYIRWSPTKEYLLFPFIPLILIHFKQSTDCNEFYKFTTEYRGVTRQHILTLLLTFMGRRLEGLIPSLSW